MTGGEARTNPVRTRRFGRMGWQVADVGYGMWGMGSWVDSDDAGSLDALHRAVELGCNFFDTALAYGDGRSERLLGELLRAHPGSGLYAATKVPPRNRQWPSRRGSPVSEFFPRDHVEACVSQSLRNAGIERWDLVQLHVWEDDWLDDPGLHDSLAWLRSSGTTAAVGISLNRWEPWNGLRAVRSGTIDSVQVIHNVFDQAPEDELLPACVEHDVAVIARVPFDEGTLTGNLTLASSWPEGDWRNTYFVPANLAASVARAEALRPLVPAGSDMSEMALRFVLGVPAVATVIPGMRKRRHVEANLACSTAGPLPADLHQALRAHRWDREPTPWSQ
ncbi:MAG TPA: aldo/keto reductase [Planctomycetota bacterium]